jgi:hypothetical protein
MTNRQYLMEIVTMRVQMIRERMPSAASGVMRLARRVYDGLHRVERAGAEVAEDDAQSAQ